jgi:hypothetical protein
MKKLTIILGAIFILMIMFMGIISLATFINQEDFEDEFKTLISYKNGYSVFEEDTYVKNLLEKWAEVEMFPGKYEDIKEEMNYKFNLKIFDNCCQKGLYTDGSKVLKLIEWRDAEGQNPEWRNKLEAAKPINMLTRDDLFKNAYKNAHKMKYVLLEINYNTSGKEKKELTSLSYEVILKEIDDLETYPDKTLFYMEELTVIDPVILTKAQKETIVNRLIELTKQGFNFNRDQPWDRHDFYRVQKLFEELNISNSKKVIESLKKNVTEIFNRTLNQK